MRRFDDGAVVFSRYTSDLTVGFFVAMVAGYNVYALGIRDGSSQARWAG